MFNKNYTEQEMLNCITHTVPFGATHLTVVPKGVVSEVDRKFKVTYQSGARALHTFIAGVDRVYGIVGVSASDGGAISSASNLIYALY